MKNYRKNYRKITFEGQCEGPAKFSPTSTKLPRPGAPIPFVVESLGFNPTEEPALLAYSPAVTHWYMHTHKCTRQYNTHTQTTTNQYGYRLGSPNVVQVYT